MIEHVSDDDPEVLEAHSKMTDFLGKLREEKGAEHTHLVTLLYNIRTFNRLLDDQEQPQAAEILSDLIGGWVHTVTLDDAMLDKPIRKKDHEAWIHELTEDVERLDALVNPVAKETMQ